MKIKLRSLLSKKKGYAHQKRIIGSLAVYDPELSVAHKTNNFKHFFNHRTTTAMKKVMWIGLMLGFHIMASAQQKVKDGTVSGSNLPNKDALLELESKNKGILHTRVSLTRTTEAAPLTAHVAGMMVYNTSTVNDVAPGIYYNDGIKWVFVRSSSSILVENQPGKTGSPGTPGTAGGPGAGVTIVNNDSGTWIFNPTTNSWTNIKGATGINGVDGKSVTSGATAPTGTGATGDTYINTTTGETYVYNGTTWISNGNIKGPQGVAGTTGAVGPQGVQGLAGTNGIDGKSVTSGTTAPTGTGATGDTYINTTTGDTYNYNGTTWVPTGNIKGPAGATGAVGPQGPAGNNGTNGTNGIDGKSVTGSTYNSTTGIVTFTYSDGTTSATADLRGATGAAGTNGTNGTNGVDGKSVTGSTYNSTTGVVTFTYSDGTTSATADVRGATGAAGTNGTNGVDGKSVTGSSYNSTTGVVTFTYSDGTTSATADVRGATGAAGTNGTNGVDGKSVTGSSYNSTTGVVTFTYSDGTTSTTADLRGATGAAGTNGTNGVDGKSVTGSSYNSTTGVVTFTYSDGTTSTTADLRGATGAAGTNGTNGVDGKSVTGSSYNSTTGVVTFTYSDGTTSATADLRGAAGTNGTNGVDGKSVTGSTYNSTTGVVTFTYSDGTTSATADLRGAAGAAGTNGTNGVDGKSVTGSTYNSTTGIVTFTYSDGTTSATADLRGATGAAGTNGTNGVDGKSVTGSTYNSTTGVVTFTYSDGTTSATADLRGATGAAGTNGTNGTNGVDGKSVTGSTYNSTTGIVTFTYSDGTTSATADLRGAAGAAGTNGTNGVDGKSVTGSTYNSTTGIVTFTYSDGTTSATADLRGAAGAAGTNGTNGVDGKSVTGSTYNSTTGIVTFTYSDGTTSATADLRGATGAAGTNGTNGVDGKSVTGSTYSPTTGVVTFTYSDGTTSATADLRGATGEAGPQGIQGPQGPAGTTAAVTADNGLTKTTDNIQLGGPLVKPTVITADATNTLAIAGLQAGTSTDNLVVVGAGGVLKSMPFASTAIEPWNEQATTTKATTNSQNIYQNGKVGIGNFGSVSTTKQFEVKGDFKSEVISGNTVFGTEVASPTNPTGAMHYWQNTDGDFRVSSANSTSAALLAKTGTTTNTISAEETQAALSSQNGANSLSGVRSTNTGNFFMESYNVTGNFGSTISLQNDGMRLRHTNTNGAADPFPLNNSSEIFVQKTNGVRFNFRDAGAVQTGEYWFPTTSGTVGQIMTQTASGKMVWTSPSGLVTEVDGVIGNEVTNGTTNGGLTRAGAGTNASPYTLGLTPGSATGNVMTWNGTAWNPAAPVNIYNANGLLTSDRTLGLNNHQLNFNGTEQQTFWSADGSMNQSGSNGRASLSMYGGNDSNLFIQQFQNSNAQISTGGNSTSLYLGTSNTNTAAPITFNTSIGGGVSGTEKMRITGTGLVGIATDDPLDQFDVGAGNVRIRDINGVAGNSATDKVVVADGNGVLRTVTAASLASSPVNIYNASGTLTNARTVTLGGFPLNFAGTEQTVALNSLGWLQLNGQGTNSSFMRMTTTDGNANGVKSNFDMQLFPDNMMQLFATDEVSKLSIGTHETLNPSPIEFATSPGASAPGQVRMTVTPTGEVAIGATSAPSFVVGGTTIQPKLHVDGDISTTGKLWTTNSVYADYVFEDYFNGFSKIYKDYKFKSLKEVAEFIKTNKHLPGVTPIKDVKVGKNGYTIDLTQLSMQQLEKLEELYLHVIEMNDALSQKDKEIKALQNKTDNLEERLKKLESLLIKK